MRTRRIDSACGLFVALFFAGVSAAQAAPVKLVDRRCVRATAQVVHDSFVNYDRYSYLDGAKMEIKIPAMGPMPLLTMIKSQSRVTRDANGGTQGVLWLVLRPTTLTDGNFYPRLLLRCSSRWTAREQFQQGCELVKDKPHYGVEDFHSSMIAVGNSPECAAGQTLLHYELTLAANSLHVEELKREVLRPAGIIASLLSGWVQEERLFKGYFSNFHDSWAKSIK